MNKKKDNWGFLKRNWSWIILISILIFGFILRAYHIDYPVVGYHNWKEVHYLTEARNFAREGFFKHGFFIPSWDYPSPYDDLSGIHSDTFPTTSVLVALGFIAFGFKLWVARGISVLFALGTIFFFYLLVKKLFNSEKLALTSAFLMALNPLFVFFGRQVMLINHAIFFGIMGFYYYIRWLDEKSWKNTIIFSLSICLCIITQYSFAIFIIPMISAFPFMDYMKRIKQNMKKDLKKLCFIAIMPVLGLLWHFYSSQVSENIESQIAVKAGLIFQSSFWKIMKSFAADNYTLLGFWLALFGMVIFIALFRSNRQRVGYKFFMGYIIGSVVWFFIMAHKMSGHNYHQYFMMPLVVFLIAFGFVSISQTISKVAAKGRFKGVVSSAIIIFLCLIMFSPSLEAKNRMFDTQFYGLDVAGDYISMNKNPGERVMHSSHQAYGMLWHGDIKGIKGVNRPVENYLYAENNANVSWLFVYNWDFGIFSDENISNHISGNYELKQMGFTTQNNQIVPLYFLFRKGGSFDISKLNDYLQNASIGAREYELTAGKVTMQFAVFS